MCTQILVYPSTSAHPCTYAHPPLQGIKNVGQLQKIIGSQTAQYDFQYHTIDVDTDYPRYRDGCLLWNIKLMNISLGLVMAQLLFSVLIV